MLLLGQQPADKIIVSHASVMLAHELVWTTITPPADVHKALGVLLWWRLSMESASVASLAQIASILHHVGKGLTPS